MFGASELGICVKDSGFTVLSQNEACIRLCGNRRLSVCREGCMKDYATGERSHPSDRGIRLEKSTTPGNLEPCEAAIINDGAQVITILYPVRLRAAQEVQALSQCGLSRRELEVFSLVAKGLSVLQISKSLFISKATLRTHLNNIYKKVPPELRHSLKKRRSRNAL